MKFGKDRSASNEYVRASKLFVTGGDGMSGVKKPRPETSKPRPETSKPKRFMLHYVRASDFRAKTYY